MKSKQKSQTEIDEMMSAMFVLHAFFHSACSVYLWFTSPEIRQALRRQHEVNQERATRQQMINNLNIDL